MKLIFLVPVFLFICSCNKDELLTLKSENNTLEVQLKESEEEIDELKKELNRYRKFLTEKKAYVLSSDDLELCAEYSTKFYMKDKNQGTEVNPKLYFKVYKSLAQSCSKLNFDITKFYSNGRKIAKGNLSSDFAANKAFYLIGVATKTFSMDSMNFYNFIVCLDSMMTAYARYNPSATEHEIKDSLDQWVRTYEAIPNKTSNSEKAMCVKLSSMIVYFQILEKKP